MEIGIRHVAADWPNPSRYKPSATELISFFSDAHTGDLPSLSDAQSSLDNLQYGCYMYGQTQIKHWCGIFACSVAVNAGLNMLKWDLSGGKIVGTQAQWITGNSGIQPGDIGYIDYKQHHVITLDANQLDWNGQTVFLVDTVEGNTSGQFILVNTRPAFGYHRLLSDPGVGDACSTPTRHLDHLRTLNGRRGDAASL